MKFLVLPPVALVPFHSADSFSALGRANAFKAAIIDEDDEKERVRNEADPINLTGRFKVNMVRETVSRT